MKKIRKILLTSRIKYTNIIRMETKLTLKLDQGAIEAAKKYAESNHKSLSKLVEDFFKHLISETKPSENYPQLIKDLSGIISEKDLEYLSQEDEKARYILRKYNE